MKNDRLAHKVQEPKWDRVAKKFLYNYTTVEGYKQHAESTLKYINKDLDDDWVFDKCGRWRLRVELRLR